MGRIGFLVSTLLAFALAATVLAAALLVGLFPTGPGVAVTSPRPSVSFPAGTPLASATPPITAPPSAPPSPTPIPPGGTYTVQPGDSLSIIGLRVGVPWQLIAEANGIAAPDYVIVPGQVLIIPAIPVPTEGTEFYVVESGDTITSIAEQFGITPTALADFNNIADWNSIQVGQILYIPSDENATPLPLPSP